MAVEYEANIPPRTDNINPVRDKAPTDPDVAFWESSVKKERAKRQFLEEKKMAEQIENPPQAPEPPFKVTGGVNLGTIDIQEENRRARETLERERQNSQERLIALEKERNEIRDALYKTNMDHLQANLMGQIESLKSAVSAGSRRDIVSELEAIEQVANKLGLSKVPQNGGGTDLTAQLAIKKLEAEIARENRRFILDQKKDERMWQLEIKKLEQQERESQARIVAEQNKYSMLAALPEQIGGVIAKGIMANGSGGGGSVSGKVATPRQVQGIEAFEGEAGETPCPACGTNVGIGPTTVQTACANCGQPFMVKRVPVPQANGAPV